MTTPDQVKSRYDYVIAGAGSAGCVLANRLSANPAVTVLLLEAGGRDTNPLIKVPRGLGELLGDPTTVWHYPTRPFGPSNHVEHWVRGKTLGGSSSVNGMIYNRGQRADYDELEHLGNKGWGWDTCCRSSARSRTTVSAPPRRGGRVDRSTCRPPRNHCRCSRT